MMNEYFRKTQICSLQQKSLHEIAKMCWGDYVLRSTIDSEEISIKEKTRELNTHFGNVLRKLSETSNALPTTFSADFPKPLTEKVVDAVIRLRQGYKDALIWEKRCVGALPFTVLNPIAAGHYQAGCFIDPTGYYNDWLWAKQFVFDENQDILGRFLIACFYCFKDQIRKLWHIMKMNGKLPCKGKVTNIQWKYGGIVSQWADALESDLIGENLYDSGFYFSGFLEAIDEYQEHAARYFWTGCTEIEKVEFIKGLRYNSSFSFAAIDNHNHTGIVYFLYSLLPLEQKNSVLQDSISFFGEKPWIWSCLLDSLYYESILNEILTFPYVIPSKFYAFQFKELAYKSKESLNPIHLKIFKIMWNHLLYIQRIEVFEWGFHISFLAGIQALDFLEFIIRTLSNSEKKQVLSNNCGGAGWTAIDQFSKKGYYDDLLCYLLYFLIDRNTTTQKLSLRADALNFLINSIKEIFTHWTQLETPESEVEEVSDVIDCLEGSLCVLDQLLQQVENSAIL